MHESLFGTDGIRTRVGSEPLTAASLARLAQAIAQWLVQYQDASRVIIAQDTRASGDWISATMQAGLLQFPIHVHDAGVLPTPALPVLIEQYGCHGGIMISASHNPYQDNGIKLFDQRGKLDAAAEQTITELYYRATDQPCDGKRFFGGRSLVTTQARNQYANHLYAMHLQARGQLGLSEKDFVDKKIVLDCAHGATSFCAPELFKRMGAQVTTLHARPNGININRRSGSTDVKALARTVCSSRADIGFAFDGDGDRMIAVNTDGQIKDGDVTLALLSQHPHYREQTQIVGTVMSNAGLEEWLAQQGKSLLRTPVGDKHIARVLAQHNVTLGGEPSGHTILKDHGPCGDGMLTAVRILEAAAMSGNWKLDAFDPYPQFQLSIPVTTRYDLSVEPYASQLHEMERKVNGRILVRYSGTQPVVRIMVEDKSKKNAEIVGRKVSQLFLQNSSE